MNQKLKKTMTYKELMDKCASICRRYTDEGNGFLGMVRAREYCVRHFEECSDITEKQIATIKNMDEYKEYQNELEKKERKKAIEQNRKENPEEYEQYLTLKNKFE